MYKCGHYHADVIQVKCCDCGKEFPACSVCLMAKKKATCPKCGKTQAAEPWQDSHDDRCPLCGGYCFGDCEE